MDQLKRVGVDTSKHTFQLHGVNGAEQPVLRKKLRRKEMVDFFTKCPPTVIEIEACGASHHWARLLTSLGHEVKLIAPHVAYCRYADDFVVIVKGTKTNAEIICEECRAFLEGRLKLSLNMDKNHITHVDDGFTFLGHRIIRRRGARGRMSVVTTIPKEKAKAFVYRLVKTLSGNHDIRAVDMFDSLNRQLAGWAAFYKFTDFTTRTFQRIDTVVFWKLAHWLGKKHRSRIRPLMCKWYKAPEIGRAKTWYVYEHSKQAHRVGKELRSLGGSPKMRFLWRTPVRNPYIVRDESRSAVTSYYREVAMALGQG